jgi:hypothetical protein
MNTILNRLSEPSTHAGLSALSLVLASVFPPYAVIFQGIAAFFASTAVVKKD